MCLKRGVGLGWVGLGSDLPAMTFKPFLFTLNLLPPLQSPPGVQPLILPRGNDIRRTSDFM